MTIDRLTAALADRYRIERELGAGGMATVYLAEDLKHERKVAIKVLRPELAAVIGAERFLREIKTIATLQHPHILGLIDSGEVNGTAYYVMPFVEGESLRDRLNREKQLPISDALRLATEVAGALNYAHRHGVIHRDIKPENIMLHDGSALVADFGIALAVSSAGGGSRMTETGMSLGTPHYMSPEQAMGEREITARSDVYALGAMTYEMLIGDPPFTGSTAQAIIAKVMTSEPVGLTTQRRSVPPAVDDAVLTALQKLPADRFATAAEFAAALHDNGGARAFARTAATRSGHAARPPAVLLRLLPWIGGIAAGAVLALALRNVGAAATPDDAVVRFSLALPHDVTVTSTGNGSTIALSPDGSLVIFIGRGIDGVQRLLARRMDESVPRTLPGTEGASQPFFSSDGAWIGFWANDRLQKIPSAGGPVQVICETVEPLGITWSASGQIVLGTTRGLMVVPAVGGALHPLIAADSSRSGPPEIIPIALADGDHVLYASWGAGGLEGVRLAVASLATRRKTVLDLAGTSPIGVLGGQLIFTRPDRNLWAVPFDVRSAKISGAPIAIANNILAVGARGSGKVSLSPLGSLAYVADNANEAHLVLTGNGASGVPVLPAARSFLFPRFSPDGKRIAVSIAAEGRSDVWLFDVASGTPVRLSSAGQVNERAEWTPDGQQVLFRSDASAGSALWWRPADLSGPATLLLGGRGNFFEGLISPDGRTLVYQVDTTGGDLEYRNLAGDTTRKTITASRADENMLRLSPDGRWVVFVTNESGAAQVVVQPFPGPGGRVQVSVNGGSEPVWSRDGRRLFYRGDGKFMAATVATGPEFSIASRTPLFDDVFVLAPAPHANYDVSPNGSQFLVLRGVGEAVQILVVRNWAAELRRRVSGSTR
ncbi:MAG: protein kinase [Gemmatimonadales bacterium]